MEDPIINKVAQSPLDTIDLEMFYPAPRIMVFDLKDHLFRQLILKEKEYREGLKLTDWSPYAGSIVAVTCTTDAIIPLWAYMLAVSYLEPVASDVMVATPEQALERSFLKNLASLDVSRYEGKKCVIKGCGDREIPAAAYAEITRMLRPVAHSIMYGEPCSTVPVFKKSVRTTPSS